jgi:nucleotide-binding universal stress UspA family protein
MYVQENCMMLTNIKKLLVPLDGSDNSFRALDVAIFLAKKIGASIVGFYAVNVLPVTEAQVIDPISLQLEEKKYANEILKKAKSLCEGDAVHFSHVISFGSPGYMIVKFIKNKDNGIDLVVIGSRGRGSMKEIFLGSVSNFVLHKSHIPVLIVK